MIGEPYIESLHKPENNDSCNTVDEQHERDWAGAIAFEKCGIHIASEYGHDKEDAEKDGAYPEEFPNFLIVYAKRFFKKTFHGV